MSGPWSRKQRARFNATIKARNPDDDTPKKRGKKKPYRKPRKIGETIITRTGEMIINASRRGENVVLLRIELV